MKIIIFCLLGFVLAAQALSDAKKLLLVGLSKMCVKQSDLSDEILKELKKRDFDSHADDPKSKAFCMCIFEHFGVIDKSGKYSKTAALSRVDDEDKKGIGETLDNCLKEVGGKLEESTCISYNKCFLAKYPEFLVF